MTATAELQMHCLRLLVLAAVGVITGLAVARRPDPVGSFGWMTAGWSLVNAVIALPGFLKPTLDPRTFDDFLAFNLGLNFAYIGVGLVLWRMGTARARGAGLAVAIQGLILLVLDGYLYWAVVVTGRT